jgi:hypothetical protein
MAAAPRPYQAVGHPVRAHRLRTGLIVALLAGYTLLGGLYVQTRPVAETGRPTLAAAAAPHQAAARRRDWSLGCIGSSSRRSAPGCGYARTHHAYWLAESAAHRQHSATRCRQTRGLLS